jgi:hypothetical protein
LAEAMAKLSLVNLRILFVGKSQWSGLQLSELATAIPRTKLQRLELTNFKWSTDEMKAFSQTLPSMNLHSLSLMFRLDATQFDESESETESVIPLFAGVSNSSIRHFHLFYAGLESFILDECGRLLLRSQLSCLRMLRRIPLASSDDSFRLSFGNEPEAEEEEDAEDDY